MSKVIKTLLCLAAMQVSADCRLYGIATELMPNGGSKEGKVIIGELDTSGDVVQLRNSTSTPHVHLLDAMSSGCGLVVDGGLAFTVGYTCENYPCPKQQNMSLFGMSIATGKLEINESTPLPWWENLDDHHTSLQMLPNGDFVVAGIMNTGTTPRPLLGGVVVMTRDGTVKQTHILQQNFGDFIKGPIALDGTGSVYLSAASLSGDASPILHLDLKTGAQTQLPLPAHMTALSITFDPVKQGAWVVAGNATSILSDGYYLVFLPHVTPTSTVVTPAVWPIGPVCLSVDNPGDNWNIAATMSDAGVISVRVVCQPKADVIEERLLNIDVRKTVKVISAPLLQPTNLTAGQSPHSVVAIFGIASPASGATSFQCFDICQVDSQCVSPCTCQQGKCQH